MIILAAVISITWIDMSEAAVRSKCFEITGRYAEACSVFDKLHCTIYSPRLRHDRDDLNFTRLGEETAHCFKGDFHKKSE